MRPRKLERTLHALSGCATCRIWAANNYYSLILEYRYHRKEKRYRHMWRADPTRGDGLWRPRKWELYCEE